MSQLSAADLQKQHTLEGTPDPFPTLNGAGPAPSSGFKQKARGTATGTVDTSSESAFPSLGGSNKRQAATTAWGADRTRITRPAVVVQQAAFTDTFDLGQIDLKAQGKDGKATTLGEVMRTVMAKSGATIEASTQRNTGKTTFVLKGTSDRSLESAKRLLVALLSPVVTKTVDAPASTIGSVIGSKGATLKEIRDKTSVRIDIPPRNTGLAVPTNGDGTSHSSRSPSPYANLPEGAEEDEPTIPISVTGPAPLVQEAIGMLQKIINVRTSKITQRVKDIPAHVLPFLIVEKEKIAYKLSDEQPEALLNFTINDKAGEIVVNGDRAAVVPAIEALKEAQEELSETLKHVTVSIPRNQHRFVLGYEAAEEFMSQHQVVIVPPEHGEGITIWGTENLGNALTAILAKSSSKHVQTVTIPGNKATLIYNYLDRTSYLETLNSSHPQVEIVMSTADEVENSGQVLVDFVGDREPVKAAVKDFKVFVKKVEDSLKEIEIDWLLHRSIQNKHAKKVQSFQETRNVIVFFPAECSESSTVLLVHDPLSSQGNIAPAAKQKHLHEVAQEISKLVPAASNVKTETITISKKWHSSLIGNLDQLLGEDQMLSIKFGSQSKGKDSLGVDQISIRGPGADVDKAIQEIHALVEKAEQDEIESSFFLEFDMASEFVGRIVGSQGATISKLRDSLSVKIDFVDEVDSKDKAGEWQENRKGAKKNPGGKVHVKITGRKENAQEAKKRILAQVDKMADETQETLHVSREYHSALIGPSGKYVNRMEETHGVKIFFPRGEQHGGGDYGDGGRGREAPKPNEVIIKGGKKGVASAKTELMELIEFEKSNNQTLKFTVNTRSVPRILGKGGVSISEIKDRTGAQIDVEKEETSPGLSTITVRGTAQEAKDAKAAIMAIASEMDDETHETVYIESKYHRNFIGKGGETLRQMIINAGGPEDPKLQSGLIHFPRNGEPENEVRLRGDKKLVAKLKKELETLAEAQRDRVTLAVGVPAAHHRMLIGRGGQHLNDLQSRTGTQIWFPGSRAYASVGDADNADELVGIAEEDLVKVVGPKSGCQTAIAELAAKALTASQPRPERTSGPGPTSSQATKTVSVPAKYHHAILQGGYFNRSLRPIGVFVDFARTPAEVAPVRPVNTDGPAARIDQDDAAVPEDVEWATGPNYVGAEDGDVEWSFRGRDEESLEAAEGLVKEAIERAAAASHVGFLTLADRSAFPRIVGTKGANVSRIRNETSTDITVGKGDNTIIIVGSESGLEAAKEAILRTASARRGD